jgi:holliday junction DNA helicase RuvA
MYEFIRGTIIERNPASVVIETAGVGYSVNISLNTYTKLSQKTEVLIYMHQVVREDAHLLFGFADKTERELFRNLISVNGVGANTAIMMLSSLSPDEIAAAVTTENVAVLKAVKGIGIKTAQRIIIDLKDKLAKFRENDTIFSLPNNTILNESLSALVMLGFVKKDAEKVISKILQEQPQSTVEGVIKQALKRL